MSWTLANLLVKSVDILTTKYIVIVYFLGLFIEDYSLPRENMNLQYKIEIFQAPMQDRLY